MKCETTTVRLRDLISDFRKGAILLPQFQRDYVWKPTKIRNLLDSLLREFPIGSFYIWKPKQGSPVDPKPKAHAPSRVGATFVGYLIDGQQRLTSLEAAFGLYSGGDRDGDALRCYLDLAALEDGQRRDTRLFVSYAGNRSVARRVSNADPALIPIEQLFEGLNQDLRKETEEALRSIGWRPQRVGAALARFDRACRMLDQLVPRTTVSELSDKDAVEVFSRLNKGGAPLRQGDVRAAELASGNAADVLKRMRDFVSGEQRQQLGFGFSFAFRALVVFHRGSAQFNALKADWIEAPGPYGRSLRASWQAAERAIEKVLSFADERMGWSRRSLIPSANALIVLAAAFDKANFKVTHEAEQLYRRWLCLTALRGVFQGSVETTINRFYRAIRQNDVPAAALVHALTRNERRKISPEEFEAPSQLWGPATQIIHAWLVEKGARDWKTGEPINELARADEPGLAGGTLTVHHIFPRQLLKESYDDYSDIANRPANYALLSLETNSEFHHTPPEEILRTLKPNERENAACQFFGEAAGDLLNSDKYDEFCSWRAKRLAGSINEWIGL
jgi:hypothetical protein